MQYENLKEDYNNFVYNNKTAIEKEFFEINDFKCTVRGIKVRGTYDTIKEAQVRAKVLQRKDPSFHVYVAQVGYWLPWDPQADDIEDQEYTEGQLNKLVKKYKENEKKRETYFEQQKKESLEEINKENEKSKKKNTPDKMESIFEGDPWLENKQRQTDDEKEKINTQYENFDEEAKNNVVSINSEIKIDTNNRTNEKVMDLDT